MNDLFNILRHKRREKSFIENHYILHKEDWLKKNISPSDHIK
ncbi:hypothetical protein bmyco0002_21880 [Bacillus pseudomycoides]|nr:hypothetical protein bmyco0002_21880 [Bacillus pseudomycoides]